MPKLSSYLKALTTVDSTKALQLPKHFVNYLPLSPKDQHDISGVVIPRVGANNWNPNSVNLEYLQKLYDCHDLVYSCIELISSTFALGRIKVKKLINGKYQYVPEHPLQKVLDNPNSSMTGYDLRQSYAVHRYLNGTVAFLLIRGFDMVTRENNKVVPNKCPNCKTKRFCEHLLFHFNTGPVTQILPCHPDRLTKEKVETPNGNREYFAYEWESGIKMIIHPDNILTDPFYNPGGSFYGTSPTAQVQRWLEIDLGLSKQIGAYLMNNAIPSMILNIKPGQNMDDDPSTMLESIKEKWMRDFSVTGDGITQGNKVKTPAFVFGELDVHKVQDTLKEIVVKPLFYEIQNRICMTYGVPPSFFEFGQDHGAQSTTIEQQEKNFYNRTISKNLNSFISKMERYLLPSYPDGDKLILEWDLSKMGIASFLEKERKTLIHKNWELGLITRDSAREALGMNPIGNDYGDDLYRVTVLGNEQRESGQHVDNQLVVKPEEE